MLERTIQHIYNDERYNDNIIEEIKDEIKQLQTNLQTKLKEYIKKQIQLSNEKKELMIDLITENKIKWIECDINTYYNYVNETNNTNIIYYKYYYNSIINKQGFYKGHTLLNKIDLKHFNEFINDYFFYGFPLYYDKNSLNGDDTDCKNAFRDRIVYFEIIS